MFPFAHSLRLKNNHCYCVTLLGLYLSVLFPSSLFQYRAKMLGFSMPPQYPKKPPPLPSFQVYLSGLKRCDIDDMVLLSGSLVSFMSLACPNKIVLLSTPTPHRGQPRKPLNKPAPSVTHTEPWWNTTRY